MAYTYIEQKEPEYLLEGKIARLFPTDKSSERRATSVFLASLMSVEEFGKTLLHDIGAKCNSRSKIECFTEVVFKEGYGEKKSDRPDGMIIVKTGSNVWRALVEVKIYNNELDKKQTEDYLDLAKKHGVQAVITISNQYVTQHILQPDSIRGINAKKTKNKLFHWSWAFLLNESMGWIKDHKRQERNISDTDQRYILREFVRFCYDSDSGIEYKYGNMGKDWQNTCKSLQEPSKKCTDSEFLEAASSWQQLVRSLALQLGIQLGEPVGVWLGNKHKKEPLLRLRDNVKNIKDKGKFTEYLNIPNASSSIEIIADIIAKKVEFSMIVDASQDKSTAKGVVNDFLRMIKSEDSDLCIEAIMRHKSKNVPACLKDIRDTEGAVLYKQCNELPRKFKVIKCIHMQMNIFNSPRCKFSETIFKELKDYYYDVGQYLYNREPHAPKMTQCGTTDNIEETTL